MIQTSSFLESSLHPQMGLSTYQLWLDYLGWLESITGGQGLPDLKQVCVNVLFWKHLKLNIQWISNDFSFLLSELSAALDQANFKWLEESLRGKLCSSSCVVWLPVLGQKSWASLGQRGQKKPLLLSSEPSDNNITVLSSCDRADGFDTFLLLKNPKRFYFF